MSANARGLSRVVVGYVPPIVVPARDLAATYGLSADEVGPVIREQFRAYRATLQDDRRHLLERFQVVDLARKVVGVGSVGLLAFVLLLLTFRSLVIAATATPRLPARPLMTSWSTSAAAAGSPSMETICASPRVAGLLGILDCAGVADGAAAVAQSLLADQLAHDVDTLSTINDDVKENPDAVKHRLVQ